MKKIYGALIIALVTGNMAVAQSGAVGIGTTTPNASAALDITSTNKGLLLPRVNSTQRLAINTPATGLIVFDTDKKLLYFYDGTKWVPLVPGDPAQTAQETQTTEAVYSGQYFAAAVGISGDYAIVGSPNDDAPVTNQGSAYIYFRSNGQWTQQAKLTATDGAFEDNFGEAVDISGEYAIVGAPQNDDGGHANRGAAYVFRRSGTNWAQVAKISSGFVSANQRFGSAVSIDGDYVAIGAPHFTSIGSQTFSQCGRVEVFMRAGAAWNFQNAVVPIQQSNAHAGHSVALSNNLMIVGVPDEDISTQLNAGAAYIYVRSGTNWLFEHRLTPTAYTANNQFFGTAVDINNGVAIVGMTRLSEPGRFMIYRRVFQGIFTWDQESISIPLNLDAQSQLGTAVAIEGDYAIVGDPRLTVGINTDQGATFVWKRGTNGAWHYVRMISTNPAYPHDWIGTCVAVDNGTIITGIPTLGLNGLSKPRVLFSGVE